MSYRAFKRLLGETSLERKCRFLFGAVILLLITGSFWLYAWQTEHLAYDQLTTTCRLLVIQIMDRQLRPAVTPDADSDWMQHDGLLTSAKDRCDAALEKDIDAAAGLSTRIAVAEKTLDEFRKNCQHLRQHRRCKPKVTRAPAGQTATKRDLLKEFQSDDDKLDDNRLLLSDERIYYYAAIRASESCLDCHRKRNARQPRSCRRTNDLIAVVKIDMPTESHRGRRPLSTAPCSSPPPWSRPCSSWPAATSSSATSSSSRSST